MMPSYRPLKERKVKVFIGQSEREVLTVEDN